MRSFRIYIDENLPVQLAKGLNILQEPQNKKDDFTIEVVSITEKFGKGAKDEDWIPEVGKEGGIVITQDYRIQTQKHQRELYRQHGVGILFINPPSKSGFSYWEMVKKVVNEWEDVKVILRKEKTPFAFRCTAKTKFAKFE
ncbi:PIN-like domain-containing protein [Cognataquiflexum aquatile]|uniref:PIN-like domain-containing protein n=1 Tax=Cognataquiflexum aquatile TaxID=2249427 RepID=UPI000DE98C28|nr:hypothetical protein [Cognataquiflexum aquatile]